MARKLESISHVNPRLQNDWIDYGIIAFNWTIIEYCDCDNLLVREQYYLDTLRPEYNINILADRPNMLGILNEMTPARRKHFQEKVKPKRQLLNIANRRVSDEGVRFIRQSRLQDKELAAIYNVSAATINYIRNFKKYKDVK